MREITVATVQMKPDLGEVEDNLVKMSDFVSKIASQQKVDMIVFPELATSGYEMGVKFTEVAQVIPGPTVNLLSQRHAVRRHVVHEEIRKMLGRHDDQSIRLRGLEALAQLTELGVKRVTHVRVRALCASGDARRMAAHARKHQAHCCLSRNRL